MHYLKNELSGWKPWEIIWFLLAFGTIFTVSVIFKSSVLNIITAVSGVCNVVLVGKGKLSAYLFGIINTALYAIISLHAKYYGVAILNIAYYFPMQFYGIYVWSKHINAETYEVNKRVLSKKSKRMLWACVIFGTTGCGFLLKALGDALPFVDALSSVLSIIAMYISIKMFAEQWILWIAVNSVNTVMWAINCINGGQNTVMLLTYIIYLLNAIIMYRKWIDETNNTTLNI